MTLDQGQTKKKVANTLEAEGGATCTSNQTVFPHLDDTGNVSQAPFDTDIEKLVDIFQRAINLAPDNQDDKAFPLSNLLAAIHAQFNSLDDIERAINVFQQAVDLTPDDHSDKACFLSNLGTAFGIRFEHLGELQDLNRAIDAKNKAVDHTPDDDTKKAFRLDSLGHALISRFYYLGEVSDQKKAISIIQRAVDLTPSNHSDKIHFLASLFTASHARFDNLEDIQRAIDIFQKGVDLTPDTHPNKASFLINIGVAFHAKFDHLGELGDINRSIDARQQAVNLFPDNHAKKAVALRNLGEALRARFACTRNPDDIERAINVIRRAIDLTPAGHAQRALRLCSLGLVFKSKYLYLNEINCRQNACDAFQAASHELSGKPSVQLKATMEWAKLGPTLESAMVAYDRFMELIPRVIWLGQTVTRRYEQLSEISPVIKRAVSLAIAVRNFPKAIEWLEQGRSVVWGQILQLRSPLDELEAKYPEKAQQLKSLSYALENVETPSLLDFHSMYKNAAMQAQSHHKRALRYDALIKEIRSYAGFSSFLKPRRSSEFIPVAQKGPVVTLVVDEANCDALVLLSSGQVIHVPLPKFSLNKSKQLYSDLISSLEANNVRQFRNDRVAKSNPVGGVDKFEAVLGDLWSLVVEPIVSTLLRLQFTEEKKGHSMRIWDHMTHQRLWPGHLLLWKIEETHPVAWENLPQITWCATGPLAFMPLHAAGVYEAENSLKVSDFVVSSYATTLTALLESASKLQQKPITESPLVLVVSQPETPGLCALPGAKREADVIQSYTPFVIHLSHDKATVENVLDEMHKCNMVHFACHGMQDKDPLDSAFALYKGNLKLAQLMKLSLHNVGLAVLSACQTATGDQKLPEESIHLAAAMLAVGFPNVIATMWSIKDNDAPTITDKLYAKLFKDQNSESRIAPAYALHEAVRHLQEQVGEKNFSRWVPFIHFGA